MAASRVQVGDIDIAYELSGPEAAPVVCLNHCFAANHRYWDSHLEAFEGYRILRFDLRGHGESDAPIGPYTLDMLAADIVNLCNALSIDRVHYCGVSLGGQVAQTFALNHPERLASLTLVNSTCEYSEEQTRMWRERASIAVAQGMSAIQDGLLRRWFTADACAKQIPGYRFMKQAINDFSPASFDAASAAMCMLHTTPRLREISVPSMVIATPNDPGAPRKVSEKMAQLIPDCELHWLEPAQHLSSLEHPERFNALMRNFLKRISTD